MGTTQGRVSASAAPRSAQTPVYRVNTTQRALLVLGMVGLALTLLAPNITLAVLALDTVAVVIGIASLVTANRVRDQLPAAPLVTLGIAPSVMGGNHIKTALAMGQTPGMIWVVFILVGFAFILLPVFNILGTLLRKNRAVSSSNLVVHHIADLLIVLVSTVGALVVLQFAPLYAAGVPTVMAVAIMCSNVGLVALAGVFLIGRTRIPGLQLGLAITVITDIISDLVLAQLATQLTAPVWTVTAYQVLVYVPLLIAMTMCDPYDGFDPDVALAPTNTFRAGLIGLWVVLFLLLPIFKELPFSVATWSLLVSVVMCLLSVRMWTLIGERDHKLNQRYAHQQLLRHKIRHDSLTNLMSRSVMKGRFYAMKVGLKNPTVLAFIRLRGLEDVRDRLGHDYGEAAIKIVAQTIVNATGDMAEAFRFRRHEFIVIFKPPTVMDDAEVVVENIVKQLRRATFEDGQSLPAYVHVGMVPVDTNRDFEDAIRWCEVAVNERKDRRSKIVRVADEHIAQVAHVTLTDQRLREALRNDAFTLVMLPIMDTTYHHCVGFEAFARWKNNDLSPTTFMRSLEQVGLADTFGRWVLNEASLFAAETNCPISVNISISHIQNSSFVLDVRAALEQSGIPPELLTIEFSEEDLSIDLTRLVMTLNQVRDLGVRIAIDDVGVGGLTMAQLSRLPIEIMKIDQTMIERAMRYEDSRHLLFNLMQAARELGLDVIAEGVESNQVLNMVIEGGCTHAQGWLWTKALSRQDAVHWWTHLGHGFGGAR